MQDKNLLNDLSDKLASLLPKAEALGSEVKDELQSKIHGPCQFPKTAGKQPVNAL